MELINVANATVTRADGSTETIVLTDKKEDGHEYMGFQCSDGVTRYALLGESTDSKASHLWIEKDGVKKYCLKEPSTRTQFKSTMHVTDGEAKKHWETTVGNLFSFSPTYINFGIGITPVIGVIINRKEGLSSGVHELVLTIECNYYLTPDDDFYNTASKPITIKGTIPVDTSTEPLTILLTAEQYKDFRTVFDAPDGSLMSGFYTYTLL